MTCPGPRDPDETARVARLLAAALMPPRRPVDLLLEDLATHGPDRFARLLAEGPAGPLSPDGVPALEELIRSQQACTAAHPRCVREELEVLAGYFACVGLALARHGVSLTRRSLTQVEPVLLDLAAHVAGEWSVIFEQAAGRAGQGAAEKTPETGTRPDG